MAHFAKLGAGNIVEKIVKVSNDVATSEQAGIDFLNNLYGSRDAWVQTSYNTRLGTHILGGTPFRKNYAGKGSYYDDTRDAFIAPCDYASWTLNEETCGYEAPIPYPNDGSIWNEATKSWDL